MIDVFFLLFCLSLFFWPGYFGAITSNFRKLAKPRNRLPEISLGLQIAER